MNVNIIGMEYGPISVRCSVFTRVFLVKYEFYFDLCNVFNASYLEDCEGVYFFL